MTHPAEPYDLDRFIDAQEGVHERALAEIREGAKRTHWMWFVFPQIAGLGSSATARRYALASLTQAHAYLAHPVLGPRLRACAAAVRDLEGLTPARVFGSPDDMKLVSCLTLFESAEGPGSVFGAALDAFCDGRRDGETLRRLR